jgi:hypothetical protein
LRNPHQAYHWHLRKIRKDGAVVWIEEIAQTVADLNGDSISWSSARISRSTSERRRCCTPTRSSCAPTPAIADPDIIDQAILAAQSPEAIVQAALDHMRALVPCRWASVAMFDSQAQVIVVLATHSNHPDEPKQVLTAHTSSGLAGMVGRVRLLDGQLTIESTPGQGTRLSAKRQLGAMLTEG